MELSALSTEYVRVPVIARENGTLVDPTGDIVEMAFVAPTVTPDGDDWNAAEWETDDDRYFARALVGPGAGAVATLTVGEYAVWVKVTDNPENPVKRAGYLTIF